MANELCLDDSCASPRISFSNDFSERDIVPIEQRPIKFIEFRFLLSQRHHQSRISTGRRTIPQWEGRRPY